jgi:molybdopterin-guanine dinucleotide biosynthesis adapter protein
MPPVVSIVGRSQSGKTTLIEKLIPEFKKRGYTVGTIKHSHHSPDIDRTGKDSSRHKAAGAETVIFHSPGTIAMVRNDYSGDLERLLDYFNDVDLVITEGYKAGNKPKIEIVRSARHSKPLLANDQHLIAVVTDVDLQLRVPRFGFEDIEPLVDMIEEKFL